MLRSRAAGCSTHLNHGSSHCYKDELSEKPRAEPWMAKSISWMPCSAPTRQLLPLVTVDFLGCLRREQL
jgi:hypothetical protein